MGQLLVGFGIAHEIGAKQAPISHGRVGKVGLAIMLEGGRGITLMGKGEGRLLSERLSAASTLPTDDEAKDDKNELIDDDSKLSRSCLMSFEMFGRLAAQKADRRTAVDFVCPNSIRIRFDFFFDSSLVWGENYHKTASGALSFPNLGVSIGNHCSYIIILGCCNLQIPIEAKNAKLGSGVS